MASHRPDRVGEQIRDELSQLLSRGVVHDPGIGFITLTRVKVSPDLQVARVLYTSLGDDKARRETAKALDRATPFLRRQIGSTLRLRRVPELEFRFDESVAHQDRIEQILRDLHAEEAQRTIDTAADDRTAIDSGSDDAGPPSDPASSTGSTARSRGHATTDSPDDTDDN
jgi:ribosome-binding factor A